MPMIDPRIIVVEDGHNPRDYSLPENRAHLDELKRSIRENGTLMPLLVRYDVAAKSAILVDGECRLRANLELIAEGVEILAVPTVQVSGGNEADRLLKSITANTGKPLSKWELGTAFQRLRNFGWSDEQIATKTGYRATFIVDAMALADAPVEVKQMLSSQAVTPSLALEHLRVNGSAAVQSLQAIASERKARGKRGPAGRPVIKAQPAPPSPAILAVVQELLEDVAVTDLSDGSKDRVTVNRLLLLKLASFAVNETPVAQAA
jgi:ParB/RepB/Spo0J family partition protein